MMLQCLYTGYYTIKDEDVAALAVFGATQSLYRGITQRERIAIFHAQMYGVGHCFQSRRLKFIAEQSFSDTFRQIKTVEAFTAAEDCQYWCDTKSVFFDSSHTVMVGLIYLVRFNKGCNQQR